MVNVKVIPVIEWIAHAFAWFCIYFSLVSVVVLVLAFTIDEVLYDEPLTIFIKATLIIPMIILLIKIYRKRRIERILAQLRIIVTAGRW